MKKIIGHREPDDIKGENRWTYLKIQGKYILH